MDRSSLDAHQAALLRETPSNEENCRSINRFHHRRGINDMTTPIKPNDDIMDDQSDASSSVSALRGWLDDFGKQNKDHYDKNHGKQPTLTKPTKPRSLSGSSTMATPSAVTLMKRLVVEPEKNAAAKPFRTPVRYKPRFKKEDVQATNDGYASVAKLSQWLADDPTSQKKVLVVRKGANVIAKSRKFEKDLEHVIIEKNQIQRGAVADKKSWFQDSAFGSNEDEDEEEDLDNDMICQIPSDLSHHHADVRETATTINVSDKKDWLKNAFKKTPGKAQSEIMIRSKQSDATVVRAKELWKKKSARKLEADTQSATAGRTHEPPKKSSKLAKEETTKQMDHDKRPDCTKANEEQKWKAHQALLETSAIRHSHYTAADSRETATTICVSDKKNWLQNVFKKEPKACSEILLRSDDDIGARTKDLWKERSARRLELTKNDSRDEVLSSSKEAKAAPEAKDQPLETEQAVEKAVEEHGVSAETKHEIDESGKNDPTVAKMDIEKDSSSSIDPVVGKMEPPAETTEDGTKPPSTDDNQASQPSTPPQEEVKGGSLIQKDSTPVASRVASRKFGNGAGSAQIAARRILNQRRNRRQQEMTPNKDKAPDKEESRSANEKSQSFDQELLAERADESPIPRQAEPSREPIKTTVDVVAGSDNNQVASIQDDEKTLALVSSANPEASSSPGELTCNGGASQTVQQRLAAASAQQQPEENVTEELDANEIQEERGTNNDHGLNGGTTQCQQKEESCNKRPYKDAEYPAPSRFYENKQHDTQRDVSSGIAVERSMDFKAARELLIERSKGKQRLAKEPLQSSCPAPAIIDDTTSVDFDSARQLLVERSKRQNDQKRDPAPDAEDCQPESAEDNSSLDFRAARQLLIRRSKENGNPVYVINKVRRKKEKFERLEQEMRRRSGPHGMLKPAWEQAESVVGYQKTYKPDIQAKKSMEELP